MKSKTFNEFWQLFLQVTFHEGKPERWTFREKKALWCKEHLKLQSGSKVADLGCGDGILDIWLSRMGCEVTAIDRGGPVIEHARTEDDTQRVQFIEQDLTAASMPNESLDGVIMIETLGLMSVEDDTALMKKAFAWLKPGGRIVVDCPLSPPEKNVWSKELPSGVVHAQTSFDTVARIHQLNFEFHPKDGDPFNLHDPYCVTRNSGPGITRYIYPQEELMNILKKTGFEVSSIPSYYSEGYYCLLGIKK